VEAVPETSAAELTAQYDYVRRDLTRIAVIAVLLFAMIFGARALNLL
jgi:hypothetical protein